MTGYLWLSSFGRGSLESQQSMNETDATRTWTRNGQRAGTLRATCIVTQAGPPQAPTCYGTFGLKGGQLAGITTLRGESRTTRIAIVGGTGSYVGARGEVISVTRGSGDNAPSDDTVRFTTQG